MTMTNGIEIEPINRTVAHQIPHQVFWDIAQHAKLTAVQLHDRSDAHNELVHEKRWLLHPSENIACQGNLFVIDDLQDGSGKIAIKHGPLPPSRGVLSEWDIQICSNDQQGFKAFLNEDYAYPWQVVSYQGGVIERTRAVHAAQQQHYGNLQINFLSNNWGDRSRDAKMNEAFVLQEIQAAKRLGVEVVQLDDGWQTGRSSNSIEAASANGRWENFQQGDVRFWEPDPLRFPNGFGPILAAAENAGIEMGLWYAPDSANEFSNWQLDVQSVLKLHRQYGVRYFKFDSINARSRQAEMNLEKLFDDIDSQSNGQIVVDLDITSATGRRPGYFGRMDCGPLFVANRYTDWHNYWPHQNLRMIWQLCFWIDPRRLRMPMLNHGRNQSHYLEDSLAPQHIDPATMFAPLMFCQPLGWFELSSLSEDYYEQVAPLVELWKQHRDAIHAGTVIPIGYEPDGLQWSGFMSVDEHKQCRYLLILNGSQDQVPLHPLHLYGVLPKEMRCLAGSGNLEQSSSDGLMRIKDMPPNSFWFGVCS